MSTETKNCTCNREGCDKEFTYEENVRKFGAVSSVTIGGYCSARCYTKVATGDNEPTIEGQEKKWEDFKRKYALFLGEQIEVIDQGIPTGTGAEEPEWYKEMMSFYDALMNLKA